jgi:hypothetical protein
VKAALHRVDAHAEHFGDLGRRESFDVTQNEHLATRWIQRRDGAIQERGQFAVGRGFLGALLQRSRLYRGSLVVERDGVRRSKLRGPPLLDAEAPRDRVEPRREGRSSAKFADPACSGEQRLLQNILRVLRVAAHLHAEPIDRRRMAREEGAHRRVVAGADGCE